LAKTACRLQGMELIAIESNEEQAAVALELGIIK